MKVLSPESDCFCLVDSWVMTRIKELWGHKELFWNLGIQLWQNAFFLMVTVSDNLSRGFRFYYDNHNGNNHLIQYPGFQKQLNCQCWSNWDMISLC